MARNAFTVRLFHPLLHAGLNRRTECPDFPSSILTYLDRYRMATQRAGLADCLLECIAVDVLPDRPNRIEPRCVKRRPKNYRRLTRPRHEAQRAMLSMT